MKRKILISLGSVVGVLVFLYIVLVAAAPLWQRLGVKPKCLSGDWSHLKLTECEPTPGLATPAHAPGSSTTVTSTAMPASTLPAPVPTNALNGSNGKMHIIFDDDGSRDGMVALLYLLNDPNIEIEAITVSYGEAHPAIYAQHIGRVLDELGIQDIPIGAGQDGPLAPATAFPDWLRELSDKFWDYQVPNAEKTYTIQNAPELMAEVISQSPEPLTLFVSGTFTNLAQALRINPGISENIAGVYIMGGAVRVPGNITNLIPESTNRVAEWNIYADPQAASNVFNTDLELYLVPLDATGKVKLSQADILPWHQGNDVANLAADLYDIMFNDYGFESAEIFDLTAAVIMREPETCIFQPFSLDISVEPGDTFGQTAIVAGGEQNVLVCIEPNRELIIQALNERFADGSENKPSTLIDSLIGTWRGIVKNKDFEMQITIKLEQSCQLGEECGTFDISTVSCSGTFIWIGMDGELYQFQAIDTSAACGAGKDYLQPRADGSVLYLSRGDYGETKGVLYKVP